MVTATVQCKRQRQEQNKATETLMCCKHTPLLKELCEPHLQAPGAKASPGAPSRALQSASAPAAVGCSQHRVAPSVPKCRHPAPNSSPPLQATGPGFLQKLSAVPSEHVVAKERRVRGQKPCGGELALVQFPPSLLQPLQVRGRHAPWLLLQHVNSMNGSKLDF